MRAAEQATVATDAALGAHAQCSLAFLLDGDGPERISRLRELRALALLLLGRAHRCTGTLAEAVADPTARARLSSLPGGRHCSSGAAPRL